MEVKALTKFARMSDKKVREIAREIQGLNAAEALEILKLVPRKSAKLVAKTLASAIANAENNNGLSAANLTISSAIVNMGVSFKRYRPVARGSAHPFRKRTSHIAIVLSDAVPAKAAKKDEKKAPAKKAAKKAAPAKKISDENKK